MNAEPHHQPERIVVGVDGSIASHAAARWAIEHARTGDTVTLIHAWQPSPTTVEAGLIEPEDDSGARALIRHELARITALPREQAVTVAGDVLRGASHDCLVAAHADLLVVGAGTRGRLARTLLGSVSSHLVHHAHVPIVIVPSPSKQRQSEASR